jgi:hypothetical protein
MDETEYEYGDEYADFISREKSELEFLYLNSLSDVYDSDDTGRSKDIDMWIHFYKTFDFKQLKKFVLNIDADRNEFCFEIPEFKVLQIDVNFPCIIEYTFDNSLEKKSRAVNPKIIDGHYEIRGWRYFKYFSMEEKSFTTLTNISVCIKLLERKNIAHKITIGLF